MALSPTVAARQTVSAVQLQLARAAAAVSVLAAAYHSPAARFPATSAAVATVSAPCACVAAPPQPAPHNADVVSVPAAELPQSPFACSAGARVSAGPQPSALDDCTLPAARSSPSRVLLHKFL